MRLALLLLSTAALAGLGAAEGCVPTTSRPEAICGSGISGDVRGEYYVQMDCDRFHLWAIWFYQESNGIPGLQRGDEWVDDTCGGQIEADTILFT